METKTELSKCFIAKTSAFKVQLNSVGDCYFHAGKKQEQGDKWEWHRAKMNDMECGQLLGLLKAREGSISFFHEFNGNATKLWFNYSKDVLFAKIENISKALSPAEQEVLRVLIEHIILRQNIIRTQDSILAAEMSG